MRSADQEASTNGSNGVAPVLQYASLCARSGRVGPTMRRLRKQRRRTKLWASNVAETPVPTRTISMTTTGDLPAAGRRISAHRTSEERGKRVVIVGAGPGGLCAAMLLAH